jgi:hypothetical protein
MRGWHGGLSISAKVKGKQLDQAYEYIASATLRAFKPTRFPQMTADFGLHANHFREHWREQ